MDFKQKTIELKIMLEKLKEKLNNLDKKQKAVAAMLLALGVPFSISKVSKLAKELTHSGEKNTLYLMDVVPDYENKIELINEAGNPIDCPVNVDTLAIVNDDNIEEGKKYEVDIVNYGTMTHGYIDGTYLMGECYDIVKTEDSFFYICKNSSPEVISVKEKNGDEVAHLSPKKATLVSLNGDNQKEIITVTNKKFVHGYVKKENLFNINFDENNNKTQYVNADNMNVRSNPYIENNIDKTLSKDTKVKIISQEYKGDNYGWYYVAFENQNELDFGWVIGEDLTQGNVIYNLRESLDSEPKVETIEQYIEEKEKVEIDKNIELQVVGIKDCLNVREEPTKNGKVITKLRNNEIISTTQSSYDNPVVMDDVQWIKIKTNEFEGWVSKEYTQTIENTQVNGNMRTLDLGIFGNQKGYYGIDINIDTPPKNLEKILTTGLPFNSSDYVSSEEVLKPSYVIIKCGATGYGIGKMHFGTTIESDSSRYDELIDVCQRNNVPFAIYYYSQAITNEEAQEELGLIKKANNIAANYSMYTNNIFIDFEYSKESRIYDNAMKNGKSQATQVLNNLLKMISSEIPTSSVHIYTDSNTMSYIINYNELLPEYQNDNWFVNVSESHEVKLNNLRINNNNVGMFQIGRDTRHGCKTDTNFMYEDFYNKFISKSQTIEQPVQPETQLEVQPEIQNVEIGSYAGAVMDASTGEILYSKNGKEQLNPASITKVLTNYIVLKYGDINDRITYSEAAVKLEGSGYNVENTSRALIPVVQVGNEISVKDAIHMSLMKSENSTTVALQEYIERKTGRNFFDIMNEEAKMMGCNSCNFLSSYGNDDAKPEYKKHLVTAEDMARIMAYINNNCPQVVEIMGTSEYTLEAGITIENLIKALNPESGSYIKGITGGKNGSTSNAGKTLVLTVERNGRTITIVTLKADSYNQSYEDAKKLADYAFSKTNQNNITSQNVNYTYSNDNTHVKRLTL